MKKIILLIIGLSLSLLIYSQSDMPIIEWETMKYDFGTFTENDGVQTGVFIFKNIGTAPLYVTSVKPSCGCTAADYTKEPIAPGETGHIKATYNPQNRPGKFNKSISVTTNTEKPTTTIFITGEVIPREKGIEDFFTKEFGTVRLRTGHLSFPKVYKNETVTDTLGIVNMSKEDAEITFENVPKHIDISVSPSILKGQKADAKHGEIGLITVKYNGELKNDWGFVIDRIDILINGKKVEKNRLSISAAIEENFSHLTEDELENAPKADFTERTYDFDKIAQGEKIIHNFEFKNTGKSDLIIRKIKASCGCTATKPEKMIVKPGEQSRIEATFNSTGKKGRQNNQITIITNDPSNTTVILKMEGDVITP